MSKRLKALVEEKTGLLARLDVLLETAQGRDFTAEEQVDYESIKESATKLEGQIEREQKYLDLQRTTAPDAYHIANRGQSSNEPTFANQRESVWDDPKRGFASFGEFAARVQDAGQNPTQDRELMRQIGAAAGDGMNTGTSSQGGVLVPPAFSEQVWDKTRQQSNSLLDRTSPVTIDPSMESMEIPCVNETSRANGSRWGGIRGYWKGELTQMTESKPDLDAIKLSPQELYVYAYISDKMLRKSPQSTSILETAAADEINFKIGSAIFAGTGAGMPRGFSTHASTVSVAKETGQAAATILPENIDKMYSRMHPNFMQEAVWLINQDCQPALDGMAQVVGVGGQVMYRPPGGISDAPFGTLKGKPVIPIEYCETLGTVGDICFVNLKAYATASHGVVDRQYSMHLKFDYAQTAFRIIFEMDGQPMLKSAMTPYKGTKTLSPFVTLATRA